MKPYLLGIDIGTSACKVALFDREGCVLAAASEEYEVYYPHPGWAEQNPEEWWDAICQAIKTVLKQSEVSACEIAGIGIDGQSWSAIAVDKDGQVLTNTPIWMDTRADDISRELNERVGSVQIFEVAGNSLQPAYTTAKIIWYQRNMPDVYRSTYKILQSNSYIAFRLTGVMTQDYSQGYGLHCFDMKERKWNLPMCEALGIPAEFLPRLCECHEIIGTVTQSAAKVSGLEAGIPVVAGGLDAACGTLGAGVIKHGETQEQGGQAGGMSICLDALPSSDTATTLGAALLAGVGVGMYADFDEAVALTVKNRRYHVPDPENQKIYQRSYETYRKLYENLKEMMSEKGAI